MTDNPPLRICVNEIDNKILLKIKTGYYLQLLTFDRKKLLESNKSKITKDENGENVLHLEVTEVALVHCNIVNKDHYQDCRAVPNKSFGQLLDIFFKSFLFLKSLSSEFPYIKVLCSDQSYKLLKIK